MADGLEINLSKVPNKDLSRIQSEARNSPGSLSTVNSVVNSSS